VFKLFKYECLAKASKFWLCLLQDIDIRAQAVGEAGVQEEIEVCTAKCLPCGVTINLSSGIYY
jgi:hypothetical protein